MRDEYELHDPAALRALAHPLRIRIIGILRECGPQNATTLARLLDETTGDTSYHLRQLARFSLIHELPQRRGRQRWWEAAARHFVLPTSSATDPELRVAGRLLRERVLERDDRILSEFLAREAVSDEHLPLLLSNEVVHITADEFPLVGRRIQEALRSFVRATPAERPVGARRVYVAIHGVPWEENQS
jgi:DNA-binding transcriptional ArsR family regulator